MTIRRILIYSHDTFGLGHLQRARTIAHALVRAMDDLQVMIVTGSPRPDFFAFDARIKVEQLAAIMKTPDGTYVSGQKNQSLSQTLQFRQRQLADVLHSFKPQMMIIDKEPAGLLGELEPLLRVQKTKGTTLVLGLRDVLDAPENVQKQWTEQNLMETTAQIYDHIWIYGPENFWNPLQGLDVPPLTQERIVYTGFLTSPITIKNDRGRQCSVLVMAGGGGDGIDLFRSVLNAIDDSKISSTRFCFLPGPFMPPGASANLACSVQGRSNVVLLEPTPDTGPLIADADHIVSMCGYNSFCEILAHGKPVLYVPRQKPRAEQFLRASRARKFGLAQLLTGEQACDPQSMFSSLKDLLNASTPENPFENSGMDGLTTIVSLTRNLLAQKAA